MIKKILGWLIGNWSTPAFFMAAAAIAWFAHMTDKAIAESAAFDRGVKHCNQVRDAERTKEILEAQAQLNAQLKLRSEAEREVETLARRSRESIAADNDDRMRRLRELAARRAVLSTGIGDGAQTATGRNPDDSTGGRGHADAGNPARDAEIAKLEARIDALLTATGDLRAAAIECGKDAGIIGGQLERVEKGP